MEAEIMITGQLLIGIILSFFGGIIILNNIIMVLIHLRIKKNYSSAPLLGGLLIVIGLFLIPVSTLNMLCWVGFVIDYTWGMLVYVLFFLTKDGKCIFKKDR